jgi:hypothetical protein
MEGDGAGEEWLEQLCSADPDRGGTGLAHTARSSMAFESNLGRVFAALWCVYLPPRTRVRGRLGRVGQCR